MTITRRIVEIKDPMIRVPLWSIWFFVVFVKQIVCCALSMEAHRLLVSDFWETAMRIYILGIEGCDDGTFS
jgi:hypothetical protein